MIVDNASNLSLVYGESRQKKARYFTFFWLVRTMQASGANLTEWEKIKLFFPRLKNFILPFQPYAQIILAEKDLIRRFKMDDNMS